MFGLLKNKLSSFIKGLTGKEEQKASEEKKAEIPKPEPVEIPKPVETLKPGPVEVQMPIETPKSKPVKIEQPKPIEKPKPAEKPKPVEIEKPKPAEPPKNKLFEIPFLHKPTRFLPEQKGAPSASNQGSMSDTFSTGKSTSPGAKREQEQKPVATAQPKAEETPKPVEQPKAVPKQSEAPKKEKPAPQKPSFAQEPVQKETIAPPTADFSRLEKRASSEKREMAPKIGIGTTIKSFFSSDITISEAEVADLLEELELSLLEADVAYDVSLEVTSQLRQRLVGMKVPKKEVERRTREAVQQVLESVMDSGRKFDFLERVKSAGKPVKILFVGPNGAGKTTTMAKVAHMLLGAKLTAVFSASDTFRAAAIEQTEVHANRLGLKVIKSKYGADPASVAFDAISFAKAHGIDVVLIDSAGRQDTNANLLDELRKINRVAKPDLKIYVGESIGGNAIIEQIKAFNETVGMDGAILTKMDCDAKGGTAISVAKSTGIPVLFLGTGQGYSDLVPFDPHKIAQEIMS